MRGHNRASAPQFFLLLLITFIASTSFAAEEKAQTGVVTQKELLEMYTDRMDLAAYYKPVSSQLKEANDAQLLKARGVEPAGGWNPQKEVTWNDVRSTLLQAGRLQTEAANKNPDTVLKERGVIVPKGDKVITPKELDKFLNDPSVNKLLQTPALSMDNVLPMPLNFSTYGMLGGSKGGGNQEILGGMDDTQINIRTEPLIIVPPPPSGGDTEPPNTEPPPTVIPDIPTETQPPPTEPKTDPGYTEPDVPTIEPPTEPPTTEQTTNPSAR